MKSFKICLSKISFNIILEIKRYKKLVKRYRTNLISLGNRKLRLPVSILSRNAENCILKYSYKYNEKIFILIKVYNLFKNNKLKCYVPFITFKNRLLPYIYPLLKLL